MTTGLRRQKTRSTHGGDNEAASKSSNLERDLQRCAEPIDEPIGRRTTELLNALVGTLLSIHSGTLTGDGRELRGSATDGGLRRLLDNSSQSLTEGAVSVAAELDL